MRPAPPNWFTYRDQISGLPAIVGAERLLEHHILNCSQPCMGQKNQDSEQNIGKAFRCLCLLPAEPQRQRVTGPQESGAVGIFCSPDIQDKREAWQSGKPQPFTAEEIRTNTLPLRRHQQSSRRIHEHRKRYPLRQPKQLNQKSAPAALPINNCASLMYLANMASEAWPVC